MEKEIRIFQTESEVETREDGTEVIKGSAAVFNSLSENLGGFREKIDPGAFDSVLADDVRGLINHDSNLVLGRTKSGTLKLSADGEALRYEIDPPNTSYANDLKESLKRGDIDQSSFAFIVDEDKWDEDDDGRVIRTIQKVKRLMDVSAVTYPAYPDTAVSVAKRAYEDFIKEKQEKEQDEEKDNKEELELIRRRKQKLLELGG